MSDIGGQVVEPTWTKDLLAASTGPLQSQDVVPLGCLFLAAALMPVICLLGQVTSDWLTQAHFSIAAGWRMHGVGPRSDAQSWLCQLGCAALHLGGVFCWLRMIGMLLIRRFCCLGCRVAGNEMSSCQLGLIYWCCHFHNFW